jgi:UDP-glucose 4-epimerase
MLVIWIFLVSYKTSKPKNESILPNCDHWEGTLKFASSPYTSTDKTVLITGAAGFIGSHVTNFCVSKLRMTVIAVDDMSSGFRDNLPVSDKVTFIKGDLKNATFVSSLFKGRKIDYIYHLAAFAAEALSHFIRAFNYRNNLVSSINLINEGVKAGVRCFIFSSSVAVYGSSESVLSETSIPHPQDPYGISKLAVELELRSAKQMHGMEYVILRLHNVFGPNQNIMDKFRNVLGIFMRQISKDKPITIFGDGNQKRSFTYIEDVMPLVARAPLYPSARNQIFNIGSDEVTDINRVAEVVRFSMKKPHHPIRYFPGRNEAKVVVVDHLKAKCFFKPFHSIGFEIGVTKMAGWFLEVGMDRMKKVKLGALKVEVKKSMPSLWLDDEVQEVIDVVHPAPLVT